MEGFGRDSEPNSQLSKEKRRRHEAVDVSKPAGCVRLSFVANATRDTISISV